MRVGSSSGQRTRHVLIEQVQTPGAQWPQWVPLDMAWMSREDLSADERFVSDQKSAYGQIRWRMAYRKDMDPEVIDVPAVRRLVYEGRTYEIQTAEPLGWKRDIALITLARTG
jgi:head-tail adaptor